MPIDFCSLYFAQQEMIFRGVICPLTGPELKLKLCPFNPKAKVDSTKLPSPASVLWPSLCECQTKKVQSCLTYLSLGQAQRTVDMCCYLRIHVYDVIFLCV